MKRYHTLAALTIFVTSCHFLSDGAHAKSVDLTGNWRYFFAGSDVEDTDSGLSQYVHRYNARWAPLITRQITMSADMAYSSTWLDNLGTRKLVNPALTVDVFNDIFAFDLSSYALQHDYSYKGDQESYVWDSTLNSTWEHALWPTLTLRGGQRWEENESPRDNRLLSEDSLRNYGGATVGWEGYKVRLFYDYFRSNDEDSVQLTEEDEERHLGQLQYMDTYLDNRVNVSFSQSVGQNTTDLSSKGGEASIRVLVSSAYATDDFTPSSGRLSLNQRLIDGNLDARAYTIRLQQPANLAIRTDFRSVDQLYVYTSKDSNLLVANTEAVTWDVYTSPDGFSWQRVAERVPSSYNRDEFRFEVDPGTIRAAYVKLVATGWMPTVDIEVTELEARAVLTGGEQGDYSSTTDRYMTEAYLGIIPLQTTRLDYTFSRDENTTSGTRDESESEQIVNSARFSWDYSRYFSPSVGFSSVVSDQTLSVDTESRSYDLRINSIPLPTVDSSMTFSQGEYFEDGDLQFTSNNIFLSTVATLYPDLTTELTLGWSLSEQELTQEQSDSSSIRWVLRSRLRKSLTADFTTEYRNSGSDIIIPVEDQMGHGFSVLRTSGESGTNMLNLSWRPSEILSFGATGASSWGEEEENTEALMLNTDYLVLRTSKTNVTLSYRFNTSNDDTYNNFGFVWGWDFSRYFTLNTNGNYIFADLENVWSIITQLTARF